MKYSTFCGAPVEPKNKLCCEPAYTGTLFWLPLIACPRRKGCQISCQSGTVAADSLGGSLYRDPLSVRCQRSVGRRTSGSSVQRYLLPAVYPFSVWNAVSARERRNTSYGHPSRGSHPTDSVF